jgi:hypothetical protein
MNALTMIAGVSIALAGCSVGAPVQYLSSGNAWSAPLVGPIEDGLLVVPIYINDKGGPYLVAIDPDAPVSVIDKGIVDELKLPTAQGGRMTDETDTGRSTYAAEVQSIRIGTLKYGRTFVRLMRTGSFVAAGRSLRGVLGRDVLADSMAFGFDRDRGTIHVTTQAGFTPPANATVVPYSLMQIVGNVDLVSRRMTRATVGAFEAKVHLDLGAVASQLREKRWAGAGLTSIAMDTETRDEAGTVQHAKTAAIADRVTLAGVTTERVLFVPYTDKRVEEQFIDGALGLGFFRDQAVWANWSTSKLYLVPRGDLVATAAERLARWADAMPACAAAGCATARLIRPNVIVPPGAGPTAPGAAPTAPVDPPTTPATLPPAEQARPPGLPRPVVMVDRDPAARGRDLEVVFAAVGDGGAVRLDLPLVVVNLPAGADSVSTQLPAEYGPTTLTAVDASPFPRACPTKSGCIVALPLGR